MWLQRSKNKYGNVRAEYNGSSYMSKKEANYAFELDLQVKAKEIKEWRKQVRVPLKINGVLICTYVVDFLITHNDDSEEYIEIKGFETKDWKLKYKMFKALFPDKKLTVIKK